MGGLFRRRDILKLALANFALIALAVSISWAADNFIIVQSTTSTQNSGLFEHILPLFTEKTGIEVRVVAVGTGQALKNAEKGDGDVVLVHSQRDEEKFVGLPALVAQMHLDAARARAILDRQAILDGRASPGGDAIPQPTQDSSGSK